MIGTFGLFVSGLPTAVINIIGLDWRFQGFDADFHRMACIAGFVRFHAREFGRLLRIQKFAGVPFLSLRRTTGQDAIIQKQRHQETTIVVIVVSLSFSISSHHTKDSQICT